MTTPNRNYNLPDAGEEDWHIPVNENWNDIDADMQDALDGGNGGGDGGIEAKFARDYADAQALMDDAEEGDLLIMQRGNGSLADGEYDEFILPPVDNLTIWSPDYAVVRSSLTPGSSSSNRIIESAEEHVDAGSWTGASTGITSNVSSRDTTINVADASIFENGDVVILHDPDVQWTTHDRSGGTQAEFIRISEADSTNDELITSQESSDGGVVFDYSSTNGEVIRFTPHNNNLVIDGLEVVGAMLEEDVGDTGQWSEVGIQSGRTMNTTIRNCRFRKVTDSAIRSQEGYRHHYHNCSVDTAGHYGVIQRGLGAHYLISNIQMNHLGRYGTSFGASAGSWAPARAMTVVGCRVNQASHAYNCHPNTWNITFRDCDASNVDRGFRVRGQGVTVDGGTIDGATHGVARLQWEFSDFTIRNVDATNISGRVFRNEPSGEVDGQGGTHSRITIENLNIDEIDNDFWSSESPPDGTDYEYEDFTIRNVTIHEMNGERFFRADDTYEDGILGNWVISDCHLVNGGDIWQESNTSDTSGSVVIRNNNLVGNASVVADGDDGAYLSIVHNSVVGDSFSITGSQVTEEFNSENL